VPGPILYLDSSAIVKLAVPEQETRSLQRLLRSWPETASSVIARIEVTRAARRVGDEAVRRADAALERIALVELDGDVLDRGASLPPAGLRTLDSIHLATALSLGDELGALCAYDARLAEAATAAGIDVLAPA